MTWGVVRRVHVIGDRCDRFEALKDPMETFRVIMTERKRREMDPTIALLERCVADAREGGEAEAYTREQLARMLDFVRLLTAFYTEVDALPTGVLRRLLRGGSKISRLFRRFGSGRGDEADPVRS